MHVMTRKAAGALLGKKRDAEVSAAGAGSAGAPGTVGASAAGAGGAQGCGAAKMRAAHTRTQAQVSAQMSVQAATQTCTQAGTQRRTQMRTQMQAQAAPAGTPGAARAAREEGHSRCTACGRGPGRVRGRAFAGRGGDSGSGSGSGCNAAGTAPLRDASPPAVPPGASMAYNAPQVHGAAPQVQGAKPLAHGAAPLAPAWDETHALPAPGAASDAASGVAAFTDAAPVSTPTKPGTASGPAALARAVSLCGGQSALASAIGVSQSHVWNWLARQRTPAEHCPAIERATRRAVRCEELRPDIDWGYLREVVRTQAPEKNAPPAPLP